MDDLRTFPLKQGDLDWLCSIYAAINLRHLRDNIFSVSAADELFKKLMTEQLPAWEWNLGRYIAEGVNPKDIKGLFNAAEFSSVKLITEPSPELIAMECSQHSGLLIYFKEPTEGRNRFSHYTIATCVTQNGDIELYDSWKFDRLVRAGDSLKAGGIDVIVSKAWRIGSPAN